MYKFESKYIIIMNSNIKQFNTYKTNIEHRYHNISLTVIYIRYYLKVCLLNTCACCGRFLLCTARQRTMTSTRQSASPGLNGQYAIPLRDWPDVRVGRV